MINTIPNNPDYDMPQDSFFKFCFLSHKDRLYTAKANLKCGKLTTAFLNISKDKLSQLLELTVQFNMFVDNAIAIKNAKTMTEFMNRIIELEKLLIDIPPYCYADINSDKEKQRADKLKHKSFYGKLYDTQSEEYAEYLKYKRFFSSIGIGLYVIYCCIEEISDKYFSRLDKRCESEYTLAWGAFNEYSTLTAELMNSIPYCNRLDISEAMDVSIGASGMRNPENESECIIVDTCEFHNPYDAIRYDFFKAVQHSCASIRCRNCGRFFHVSERYISIYCNEKSPQKPNRTCRQIGAKNKHKEKAENNTILHTYNKARSKYYQHFMRGNISEDEYTKIRRYLEEKRDLAIRGKTDSEGNLITSETLEQLFKKKVLFEALDIGEKNG
ncbi:MAG: hypothetical protein IKL31_00650 [Ruminococcus sp.]|nr:hypothetical protein [Ruminococcus sp.]